MSSFTEAGYNAILNQLDTIAPFEADTSILTLTGVGNGDETIVIGDRTYTMKSVLVGANDIKIGSTSAESAKNIVAAINAATGAGTKYGTGTLVHDDVYAVLSGSTVIVYMRNPFAAGLSVSETSTAMSWSVSTMAGAGDVSSSTTEGRQAVNSTLGAASSASVSNDVETTWTSTAGNAVAWTRFSNRRSITESGDTIKLLTGLFSISAS